MILVIDTSTAACTAALFDQGWTVIGARQELIGRGHAERLMPMVADLLEGRRAQHILVGVGPGSFTGIRVGIAAAHGMAIGWGAPVSGMSSVALLAAAVAAGEPVAAAMAGGHGELFVQQFDTSLEPVSDLLSLPPAQAAEAVDANLVVGNGAEALVEARGWGEAKECWPSAAAALKLPASLRSLAPVPVYARAPDARVKSAA